MLRTSQSHFNWSARLRHNDLRFCCGAAAAQPPRRARKNGIPAAADAPHQRGPDSSKRGLGGGRGRRLVGEPPAPRSAGPSGPRPPRWSTPGTPSRPGFGGDTASTWTARSGTLCPECRARPGRGAGMIEAASRVIPWEGRAAGGGLPRERDAAGHGVHHPQCCCSRASGTDRECAACHLTTCASAAGACGAAARSQSRNIPRAAAPRIRPGQQQARVRPQR